MNRLLYVLKQSHRQCNRSFDKFMAHIGFTRSQFDHNVYLRFRLGSSLVTLLLYMDDILVAHDSVEDVMKVKVELDKEFGMKDLGDAFRIFGIDIQRDRKQLRFCLSQETYLLKILDRCYKTD